MRVIFIFCDISISNTLIDLRVIIRTQTSFQAIFSIVQIIRIKHLKTTILKILAIRTFIL